MLAPGPGVGVLYGVGGVLGLEVYEDWTGLYSGDQDTQCRLQHSLSDTVCRETRLTDMIDFIMKGYE